MRGVIMPTLEVGSALSGVAKPKESRRWLRPRVPDEQLYRLAPVRPNRTRLGMLDFSDRTREVVREWWAWFIVAVFLELLGWRITGVVLGAMAFVLYHTSTDSHPAVYALEPDFDAESDEFRTTMVGVTGMPLVDGRRVDLQQWRRVLSSHVGGHRVCAPVHHHGAIHLLEWPGRKTVRGGIR